MAWDIRTSRLLQTPSLWTKTLWTLTPLCLPLKVRLDGILVFPSVCPPPVDVPPFPPVDVPPFPPVVVPPPVDPTTMSLLAWNYQWLALVPVLFYVDFLLEELFVWRLREKRWTSRTSYYLARRFKEAWPVWAKAAGLDGPAEGLGYWMAYRLSARDRVDDVAKGRPRAYPTLSAIELTDYGITYRLKPLTGQVLDDWRRALPRLLQAMRIEAKHTEINQDADGHIVLRLWSRHPLEHVEPSRCKPHAAEVDIGQTLEGRRWALNLVGGHVLVGGITGSGKSGVLASILDQVARADDVVAYGIDLKLGLELSYWSDSLVDLACTDRNTFNKRDTGSPLPETYQVSVKYNGTRHKEERQRLICVGLDTTHAAPLHRGARHTRHGEVSEGDRKTGDQVDRCARQPSSHGPRW